MPPTIAAVAVVTPTGEANNPVAIPVYFGEVLRKASSIDFVTTFPPFLDS